MQGEKVEWKNWKLCSAKILRSYVLVEGRRKRRRRKIRWKLDFHSNVTNITLIKKRGEYA